MIEVEVSMTASDLPYKLPCFLSPKLLSLAAWEFQFKVSHGWAKCSYPGHCCRLWTQQLSWRLLIVVSWVFFFSSFFLIVLIRQQTDNILFPLSKDLLCNEACRRRQKDEVKKFPNEVLCTSLSALFTLPFQFAGARNSYKKSINYTRDLRHAVKWIAKLRNWMRIRRSRKKWRD